MDIATQDDQYPERWRSVKKAFSTTIPKTEYHSKIRIKRVERGIWQRRFSQPTIIDEADYIAHMDYIHYNPVKHGWVHLVKEWPFSSGHRLIKVGVYLPNWAGSDLELFDAGEMGGLKNV